MKTILLICLSIILLAGWSGKVVSVHDGDTITVQRQDGTKERIRLFGVDCPELKRKGYWESQPYSRKATDFVKAIFANENSVKVSIWEMGESYGRVVGGVITLYDGHTLQEELVQAGLAWVDTKYCKRSIKECKNWTALQKEAQKQKLGLWRDGGPVPPWVWRGKPRDR